MNRRGVKPRETRTDLRRIANKTLADSASFDPVVRAFQFGL